MRGTPSDVWLSDDSDHLYLTNGILSHFCVLRRHGLDVFGGHLAHLAATRDIFRQSTINLWNDFLPVKAEDKKTPVFTGVS